MYAIASRVRAWPARWEEAADDGEGHFAELASIGLPV